MTNVIEIQEISIITWLVINCIILSIWIITFLCYCCFPSSKSICPEGTTEVNIAGYDSKCDNSVCIKIGDSIPTFINKISISLDQKIIDDGLKKYWDSIIILTMILLLINIFSLMAYWLFTKRNKHREIEIATQI